MKLEPATEEELLKLINDPAYEDLVIWKGNLWTLYLNAEQRYLGRSYVWFTGEHLDFHQLHELMPHEWQELQLIMRAYRATVGHLWNADMVNCSWLGNEFVSHRGHGHMHLVPRYRKPPSHDGIEYPDERFGSDYKPYQKLKLEKEALEPIVIALQRAFQNYLA